jgi:beta-N-acetylhexosaminidase
VAATAKHFPGLGRARSNTDRSETTIIASPRELAADIRPFGAMVNDRIPLMMLSTAIYPALDQANAAAWSPLIVQNLLRGRLAYRGVTITDDLASAGVRSAMRPARAAVAAVASGADLVLFARPGSDRYSRDAYNQLLAAACSGRLSRGLLEASYRRVERVTQTFRAFSR